MCGIACIWMFFSPLFYLPNKNEKCGKNYGFSIGAFLFLNKFDSNSLRVCEKFGGKSVKNFSNSYGIDC